MTVIQLEHTYLKSMKRKLRDQCSAGSVQLTEAIARGCGYRTNAALLADINSGAEGRYVAFDDAAFRQRLRDFDCTVPDEIELPELDRSVGFVERLFEQADVEIVEMHPIRARFRLAGIDAMVQIDLEDIGNGYTRFHHSHAIHTPTQIGPYRPSRDFDDDPAYAMHRAVTSIVDYYREAVRKGHTPERKWLVDSRH
ncbi:hypothetical protein [Rhizobium sp. GR12]|uniref:hypothetical protein n=1 Tax=Rhizobium sp. GR12 TaxID=3053925 RepID=UPI002FBF166F